MGGRAESQCMGQVGAARATISWVECRNATRDQVVAGDDQQRVELALAKGLQW